MTTPDDVTCQLMADPHGGDGRGSQLLAMSVIASYVIPSANCQLLAMSVTASYVIPSAMGDTLSS